MPLPFAPVPWANGTPKLTPTGSVGGALSSQLTVVSAAHAAPVISIAVSPAMPITPSRFPIRHSLDDGSLGITAHAFC